MTRTRIFFVPALICLLLATMLATLAQAAVPGDFRELVKAAAPAVVNINTERTASPRGGGMPPGFDMFRRHPDFDRFFGPFEDFMGPGGPRARKQMSLGSGFIISADGYIVTNNHVVEGANVIRVNLLRKAGGKEEQFTAELVGADPETDLALIKIKATDLPYLRFGDSDKLEVGEWVVAIGSPLGLDHTVTAGIVSAKRRNIQSGPFDDYLQTDASINQGNSGGPLLNMAGEVVGINTAIAQRAQGIGFAIPSSMAQSTIEALKEHKKVSRGWLGVTIQNVDEATAKALGMSEAYGAMVNSVLDGQPAAKAGIKSGDVIIAVNGKRVEDTEQLLRHVASLTPGAAAKVTVWRDGKEEELTLTVAERDLASVGKENGKSSPEMATGERLGVKVRPVTREDMRRYNLSSNDGLLVTGVEDEGLAGEAGIEPGDVILGVNGRAVGSVAELAKAIDTAAKGRGAALLHISRRGQVFYRGIELKK